MRCRMILQPGTTYTARLVIEPPNKIITSGGNLKRYGADADSGCVFYRHVDIVISLGSIAVRWALLTAYASSAWQFVPEIPGADIVTLNSIDLSWDGLSHFKWLRI